MVYRLVSVDSPLWFYPLRFSIIEIERVFARGYEAWWAGSWAQSAHRSCACERDKGLRRILNATALVVAFLLPLFGGLRLHGCRVSHTEQSADVGLGKATASYVAFKTRHRVASHSQPLCIFKEGWPDRAVASSARPREELLGFLRAIRHFGVDFGTLSLRGRHMERGRRRVVLRLHVLREGREIPPSFVAWIVNGACLM
ncbi:hypothetical protein Taro_048978 [Colocasia esculenta]|uniref:Uncharacterized protein n=1 Tax=Colocasia esculenta TaxID=4460 RepID=A0A843X9M0_COLES|nr:hypothetical protein [Colocasia esculenta]